MVLPTLIDLIYAPANAREPSAVGISAAAKIVELSDDLVDRAMGDTWWMDGRIVAGRAGAEIDRHWAWNVDATDWEGRELNLRRLAVVTDDGAVQGAMLISVDGVPMEFAARPGEAGLFVERLFTAPRNRPGIIVNAKQPIFFGVGSGLLRFAVELSRARGCAGRLKLDGSPGAIDWYRNRGLLVVPGARTMYEEVEYVGMELSALAADALVSPAMG